DLAAPAHVDEPLLDEAEQELGLAAPAVRVVVGEALAREEKPLLLQPGQDLLGRRRVGSRQSFHPPEAVDERALGRERRDRGEALLAAERPVLLAAAGSDVDDAGAVRLADFLPRDDAVRVACGYRGRPVTLANGRGEDLGISVRVLLC